MKTLEDIEEHMKLEVYSGKDEKFLPPGIHPESTVYRAVLITSEDQEEFAVFYRNEYPTLESVLSFLLNFAIDGIWKTYNSWKEENEDSVAVYGEESKEYYRYARDIYVRMRRLLGNEAFNEYINS